MKHSRWFGLEWALSENKIRPITSWWNKVLERFLFYETVHSIWHIYFSIELVLRFAHFGLVLHLDIIKSSRVLVTILIGSGPTSTLDSLSSIKWIFLLTHHLIKVMESLRIVNSSFRQCDRTTYTNRKGLQNNIWYCFLYYQWLILHIEPHDNGFTFQS